ncbi:MAG: hypothetical protein ACKVOU_05375, partial [Cytophagales bacterium]
MKRILLVLFSLSVFHFSFGVTRTFDGSTSTLWHIATNWSGNVVPTIADDVIIPTGLTVNISTTISDPNAICNNLTVSGTGVLNIPGTKTITINGSVFGNGAIATTNFVGVFGTLRLRGNNNHTGAFTPNIGGSFYYEGAGTQSVRVTNYGNLIIAGSGTKLMPTGATFTISSGLTINAPADLNIGAGATKTMVVAGNAIINGDLYNGSSNGNIIRINGNLSGSGRIVFLYSAISELQLYGASNSIGALSSLYRANHTVSYLRNGNQTVFGSDEYPNLNISGSGVKTALGNIACAGASIAAEFTLGTVTTASVGQYNFASTGSISIFSGGNNKFDFGSATAKRVDFQGGITAYAPLVITGTGLAHYVAVGDVLDFNASSIVHSTGQGTTFDYYGINMGILDNNKIVYENLILSGSGNYTLQNGGILD